MLACIRKFSGNSDTSFPRTVRSLGAAVFPTEFDPSTSITDAQFRTNTEVFAYARSLNAWGKAAKFDVVLPYTSFSGHGTCGRPAQRTQYVG